jgi:Mg-chelatase subunit ChlD
MLHQLLLAAVLTAPLLVVETAQAKDVTDHVQGILHESQEQIGGAILQQIATQAGYKTVGEFVAAIPPADLAEAVGAASGGDPDAAQHAMARGIAKVLAASGVKTFAFGAGAVGAAPIAVGIGAAVLTGMIIDGVRDYRQQAMQQRVGDMEARYAAVNDRDKYQVEYMRNTIQFYSWILEARRTFAGAERTWAMLDHREYVAGKITYEQYVARIAERNRKMTEEVNKFQETYGELRDRVHQRIDYLEQELAKIKAEHERLAQQDYGHLPEVSAEMRVLYRRYIFLRENLEQLKAQFPDPELSIVFLVDCSGSMQGAKIKEAIAAVKQAVDTTNDGNTEWALISFASCNATTVCGFTRSPGMIQAAASRLSASGDTPLSFALAKASTYLKTRGRGRTGRLILLADGEDNCRERGAMGPDEAGEAIRPMYRSDRDVTMPTRNP